MFKRSSKWAALVSTEWFGQYEVAAIGNKSEVLKSEVVKWAREQEKQGELVIVITKLKFSKWKALP